MAMPDTSPCPVHYCCELIPNDDYQTQLRIYQELLTLGVGDILFETLQTRKVDFSKTWSHTIKSLSIQHVPKTAL